MQGAPTQDALTYASTNTPHAHTQDALVEGVSAEHLSHLHTSLCGDLLLMLEDEGGEDPSRDHSSGKLLPARPSAPSESHCNDSLSETG